MLAQEAAGVLPGATVQRAHQHIMAIVLVFDQRRQPVGIQHSLQAAEGVVLQLASLLVIEHVAEFVVVEGLLFGVILKQPMLDS
ncbi:hypothetical protein D3C76_1536840 [compost metagenome]